MVKNMYKVSIVDDEQSARDGLAGLLSAYGEERGLSFSVRQYAGAEEYLAAHDGDSDIVFLDIDMPGVNGMDLAKEIRRKRPDVILIFCTNLEQFALNGYEVDAFGYLVKPVGKYSFDFYIDKALKRLDHYEKVGGGGRKICIKTIGEYRCVSARDIGYVEVKLHKLFYHVYKNGVPDEVIQTRGSMQEAERQLAPFGFVKSSISYLVNLGYVTAIKGNAVYLSDDVIFVSRNYKKSFVDAFMRSIAAGETDAR